MCTRFSHHTISFSRLLFLAVVALISACSGIQTAQHYQLNDDEGLVFFSLSASGVVKDDLKLRFVSETTQKTIMTSFRAGEKTDIGRFEKGKNQYSYDAPVGKLIVLRLPEGVYRLDHWNSGSKKLGKSSLKPSPNKKFRVENGRILYLGNLHRLESKSKVSLITRDNRLLDKQLFYKRYSRVNKSKLLIASQLFLNPATDRERLFDAYASCSFNGYELISKKRLPDTVEPFRVLRIGSEEKQVSRIDGYRLKFRQFEGPVTLGMKVELSDNRQYQQDKKVVGDWIEHIKKTITPFEIVAARGRYFDDYQISTNVLEEKRMVYMGFMLDDVSQIMTSLSFINPPEFMRPYQSSEEFVPVARQLIAEYKRCVIDNLNKIR